MKSGVVYALIDPVSNECRYVGITTREPEMRLYAHVSQAKKKPVTHKDRWIAKLLRNDLRPYLEILEENVPADTLPMCEIVWIEALKSSGVRLTNSTAGGEGILDPSPEVRARIGSANRGKKASPEQRDKLSRAQTGRKHSEQTKQKMSRNSSWRRLSDEARERGIAKLRGRKRSPEANAKAAATLRGRKHSDETKRRKSEALSYLKKPVIDSAGRYWPGLSEAARGTGSQHPKVWAVCSGRRKSTNGLSFRYATPEEIAAHNAANPVTK